MNIFYLPEIKNGNLQLNEDESQHVIKVLRHDIGDELAVTDGQGKMYYCSIASIAHRCCSLTIIRTEAREKPHHHIHIALAPTKSADRTEWFVEKATEIGIQEITFLQTHHSERSRINVDRIQRVAISALKQSGQVWLPKINDLIDFKEFIKTQAEQKFIAYVDAIKPPKHLSQQAIKNRKYSVLIGPEGDFSEIEINHAIAAGYNPISLGTNTLRSETAALAACHALNLVNLWDL